MPQLRADARDNRDRILASARVLFSERGLDVGMREVARRAEIGPATLYRRFPTKQELVEEAFALELRACRQIVIDGAGDPDPWRGFASVIRRLTALNVRNRGFVDAFTSAGAADGTIAAHRRELLGMLAELARRAQSAGDLRADFRIEDLTLVLLAGRGLSAAAPERRADAAERFAELAIAAFRAESR
ncbi:TetR/AcrR family transcriptional regulator [Leifsonia sp. RAF41]|uniref:TetR/AcrR family transcriptional regulator n=1 Tax=Leifsonia sp. RAF41 TaxID=3233056 RepID=UPI003F99EB08